MQVTFHGVRGSTPCHGDDVSKYGGNTSCVSLAIPGAPPVIFDMGTGLRYFGATQPCDGTFRGTCLLTHLHWDHTQGLPFFAPMLEAGAELDIYAPVQDDGCSVAEAFGTMIKPPVFPVSLSQVPGTFRFHEVGDAEFTIGEARVLARVVPHVGTTLGFRVEWKGQSVAYISDHQQPYDGSLRVSDGALELADGVDLLIHDSQYTPEEFVRKFNWGHCTLDYAVWFAGHARVKTLAMFHHDPMRNDDAVDGLAAVAEVEARQLGVRLVAAREGLTLDVG